MFMVYLLDFHRNGTVFPEFQKNVANCTAISDAAFGSHVPCYDQCGFCGGKNIRFIRHSLLFFDKRKKQLDLE